MMKRSLIIIICIFIIDIQGYSQLVPFSLLSDNNISVTGTSTLHDWTLKVNSFSGQVHLKKAVANKQSMKKGDAFDAVEISLEVKSMESGRGASMDNRVYEALKAENYPTITFKSKNAEVVSVQNNIFNLQMSGDLTIAGITKPIDLKVEGQKLTDGKFTFSGSKSLKMTDFDIKPPSAMFGQIVAGDDITIKFEQLTITSIK